MHESKIILNLIFHFISCPITALLSCPIAALFFCTYEYTKKFLNLKGVWQPVVHMTSAALGEIVSNQRSTRFPNYTDLKKT